VSRRRAKGFRFYVGAERPGVIRLAGVEGVVSEAPKPVGYHPVTFVVGMQSVLTHALISEADFDVGYAGVGCRRCDVTSYSVQIRSEYPLGPRDVTKPHGPDDGVLCGTQTRDLVDYGIPVPFDPIHDLAQARLVVRATAGSALVDAPRLTQVVEADVDRDDFTPSSAFRIFGSLRIEWSSWVLVWPLSPRLITLRRANDGSSAPGA
jgi:hypothetical protein